MKKGKRINYDDDIVIVYKYGKEIYKGLEDYEPMKDEPWIFSEKDGAYYLPRCNEYRKICL